jgi:uncharacterized cupin superfamily protein
MSITSSASVSLGPHAAMHLGADLEITPLALTPDFWAHNASLKRELAEGRILSVFDYTDTWSYWERHPVGDELVYLLAGEVDILLDDGQQTRSVGLRPGEAAIVPEGTWHRAVIHAPSRLLFVTPTPHRTEQRP